MTTKNNEPNINPPVIIRSPDYKDIYSNASRINASPFDFSIVFGRTVEYPPSAVEDLAVIRFSPQQFKAMADSINRLINSWESAFGQIKATIPPHKDEIFDNMIKDLHTQVFGK